MLTHYSRLLRTALQGAKRAVERRLQIDRAAFQTLEDFQRFVATRGNALQLTAPRPVKVFQPQTELNELFQSLVGGTPRRNSEARTMFPKLDSAFRQLADEKLAELHVPITVPVLGKLRHVPYAYQNGVWNLIEPKRFSGSVQTAVNLASRMAIEGDLLRRHGIEGRGKVNLIVVPQFEESTCVPMLQQRVGDVLKEYEVETVGENQIDEFLARVRREAHQPCEQDQRASSADGRFGGEQS